MAEAEGIPPTASVASTSLSSIRYVADYAYALSGTVAVPNVETTLLDALSGMGVWDAIVQVSYGTPDSDNMQYKIYFNEVIVMQFSISGAVDVGNWQTMLYHFIIPPFTQIKVTAQNTTSVSSRIQTASITGRVYDA